MAAPADYLGGLVQPGAAAAAAAAGTLQPTPLQQPGAGRAVHPLPAQLQQVQYQSAAGQQQAALPYGGVPLAAPVGYATGQAQLPPGGGAPLLPPLQGYAAAQQLLWGGHSGAGVAAAGGSEDLLYVNPRQLAGILRRRKQREAQLLKAKAQPQKAGKKAARRDLAAAARETSKARARSSNGRFMGHEQLAALERRQAELADAADAAQAERDRQGAQQQQEQQPGEQPAQRQPADQQDQQAGPRDAQQQQQQGAEAQQEAQQEQPVERGAAQQPGQASPAAQRPPACEQLPVPPGQRGLPQVGSPGSAQRRRRRGTAAQRAADT